MPDPSLRKRTRDLVEIHFVIVCFAIGLYHLLQDGLRIILSIFGL